MRLPHHPHNSHYVHQRRSATARAACAAPVPGNPTVPRKPVPSEEALAQTRQYIDSAAGPDRSADIVRLRAQAVRISELVPYLAQAHAQLTRVTGEVEDTSEVSKWIDDSMWPQRDRLWQRQDDLRQAEAAQQSRQAWLDEHPEVLAHLAELSARVQPRPGLRPIRRSARPLSQAL